MLYVLSDNGPVEKTTIQLKPMLFSLDYAASGVMRVGHNLTGVGVAGRIYVQLDNGDPDSFDIVTESQGETVTSSNLPWTKPLT